MNNNDFDNDQHHNVQQSTTRDINQNSYPFRIADVQLPDVQSGYVYMLISLRHPKFIYW